jgi:cobalt/nickel transport system permease protein
MTLALDVPLQTDSPLGRFDPRWKLAALFLAALAVALLQTIPAAALALAGALGLAWLARLPRSWFLARLGVITLVLLVFVLPLPFFLRGEGPSYRLGILQVSGPGLTVALLLVLRTLAVVTLLLVLVATAPLEATLKAAHRLRVPGLFVQLALLSYRYLFVLGDELARLRVALRTRGYRNRASRHCYRTIGHVAGTLLVRGHERAERVSQAMRCRGFDGRFRTLNTFRTRWTDVLTFLVLVGAAVGLTLLDRTLREGA